MNDYVHVEMVVNNKFTPLVGRFEARKRRRRFKEARKITGEIERLNSTRVPRRQRSPKGMIFAEDEAGGTL